MTFNSPVKRIKRFDNRDPNWHWTTDGFTLVPRAAIIITDNCPKDYQKILFKCITNGWIEPIAYVPESTHVWEKLKD